MEPKTRHPYLVLENEKNIQAIIYPRYFHVTKDGKICGIYLNQKQPGSGTFRMTPREFTRVRFVV